MQLAMLPVVVAVIGRQQRTRMHFLRHGHVDRAAEALRTRQHLGLKETLPTDLQHLPLEARHHDVHFQPERRGFRINACIDFPQGRHGGQAQCTDERAGHHPTAQG